MGDESRDPSACKSAGLRMTGLESSELSSTPSFEGCILTATSYSKWHPSEWQNCSALPSGLTERRGVGGRGRRGELR
jgi:hypothetical protein